MSDDRHSPNPSAGVSPTPPQPDPSAGKSAPPDRPEERQPCLLDMHSWVMDDNLTGGELRRVCAECGAPHPADATGKRARVDITPDGRLRRPLPTPEQVEKCMRTAHTDGPCGDDCAFWHWSPAAAREVVRTPGQLPAGHPLAGLPTDASVRFPALEQLAAMWRKGEIPHPDDPERPWHDPLDGWAGGEAPPWAHDLAVMRERDLSAYRNIDEEITAIFGELQGRALMVRHGLQGVLQAASELAGAIDRAADEPEPLRDLSRRLLGGVRAVQAAVDELVVELDPEGT